MLEDVAWKDLKIDSKGHQLVDRELARAFASYNYQKYMMFFTVPQC